MLGEVSLILGSLILQLSHLVKSYMILLHEMKIICNGAKEHIFSGQIKIQKVCKDTKGEKCRVTIFREISYF